MTASSRGKVLALVVCAAALGGIAYVFLQGRLPPFIVDIIFSRVLSPAELELTQCVRAAKRKDDQRAETRSTLSADIDLCQAAFDGQTGQR